MAKYKEDWWHTDAAGRRIGWMKPERFEGWINSIFPYGKTPRQQFADAMGIDVSKVSRWMTGKDPIPKWVARLPELLCRSTPYYDFNDTPDAPWLPETESVCGKRPANAGGTDAADTTPRRGRPRKQAA